MTDINNIRDAVFEKGFSISEAAREFNKDRKTIRKLPWRQKPTATGLRSKRVRPYFFLP